MHKQGSENFDTNLSIKLIQSYGCKEDVANHLVSTYGMRAPDVLERSFHTKKKGSWPRIADGYPFLEAEVSGCVGW